jgi:hypothetical protein
MDQMSFTWTLSDSIVGWAECTAADQYTHARVNASDVTGGPEYLLRAVRELVSGAERARAEFEAEPVTYRWIFCRDGATICIQILRLDDRRQPDDAGTLIWTSRQRIDVLGQAITSGFDQVARNLGETGYRSSWMRPFPHAELEDLRTALRSLTE